MLVRTQCKKCEFAMNGHQLHLQYGDLEVFPNYSSIGQSMSKLSALLGRAVVLDFSLHPIDTWNKLA